MPHFGLIEEDLPPDEKMSLRARLHWRGGEIRSARNENADAIASFYDAFTSAMKRFFISDTLRSCYALPNVYDLEDDEVLFLELKGAGILDESVSMEDYTQIETILESAFMNNVTDGQMLFLHEKLYTILDQLGILPFSDSDLPEEVSLTT